jgi:hypothetical protein
MPVSLLLSENWAKSPVKINEILAWNIHSGGSNTPRRRKTYTKNIQFVWNVKIPSTGYYLHKNKGLVAYLSAILVGGVLNKIRHISRHNQRGPTNIQLSDKILGPCQGAQVLGQEVIDRTN